MSSLSLEVVRDRGRGRGSDDIELARDASLAISEFAPGAEAHLIPGNSSTMYRRFLDALTRINPALKVIGLTA